RHDVALAVLEPGGFRAAGGHDTARALFAIRHVVVLERDAARFQLGHFALDVRDLPEGLARLGRARILRRIEEAGSPAGELVDDAPGHLLFRVQADLLLVKPSGPGNVPGGNVGMHGKVLQHDRRLGFLPSVDRHAGRSTLPAAWSAHLRESGPWLTIARSTEETRDGVRPGNQERYRDRWIRHAAL